MKTFAIVPVKRFENGKTRLAPILTLEQRVKFLHLLLDQTIQILDGCKTINKIVLVSGDPRAKEIAGRYKRAELIYQEKDTGVNSAVRLADKYSSDKGAQATIVVPQDLPLLQVKDIEDICAKASSAGKNCVVICPALRYDGTNILLRKPPGLFNTHYDDDSYKNHIESAKKLAVEPIVFKSENLMSDIDTPEDARLILRKSKNNSSKAIEYLQQLL